MTAPDSRANPYDKITVEQSEPWQIARGSVMIKMTRDNTTNIEVLSRTDAVKLCAALMAHLKSTRPEGKK
jgi:hypothetical protein